MSISLAFSCGHALVIDRKLKSTKVEEFIYHKLLVHPTLVCQLNVSPLGTPSSEHTAAIGKNNVYNYGGYHYDMLPL